MTDHTLWELRGYGWVDPALLADEVAFAEHYEVITVLGELADLLPLTELGGFRVLSLRPAPQEVRTQPLTPNSESATA